MWRKFERTSPIRVLASSGDFRLSRADTSLTAEGSLAIVSLTVASELAAFSNSCSALMSSSDSGGSLLIAAELVGEFAGLRMDCKTSFAFFSAVELVSLSSSPSLLPSLETVLGFLFGLDTLGSVTYCTNDREVTKSK